MSGEPAPGMAAQPARIWQFGAAEFDESRRELRLRGATCAIEAKPLSLLQELLTGEYSVAP
jgi:hypothetical protein